MFRMVRGDTLIKSIEERYNIDLRARGDMKLDNLLNERGFDSLTQLLDAYHGRLTYHARRRRIFFSFHAEDMHQVQGFRLMSYARNLEIDFYDCSLSTAINSDRAPYVKQCLTDKIKTASVVVCLIGNGTAWREWVDWELRTAFDLGKGICGIRLKNSHGRTPPLLKEIGAAVVSWGDVAAMVAAIECAAARRN